MNDNSTMRAAARHDFFMPRGIDEVFALFDPIAEKDWVPGWDPEPVHPAELSLEEGSVFFLQRPDNGAREIWTVLRHDPAEHQADYLATDPDHQQRWIRVNCVAEEGGTRVFVEYRVTALAESGREGFDDFGPDFIKAWEAPVAKALGVDAAA